MSNEFNNPVVAGTNRWFVRNGDGNEEILDAVTDAEALSARSPAIARSLEGIHSLRNHLWDLRKPTSNGAVVGGAGVKWVASIPPKIAFAAELAEPNLFKDEKTFFAWLRRNPQYSMRAR